MPANRRPMPTTETTETTESTETTETTESTESTEIRPTLQEVFRDRIAEFNLRNYNMSIDDFEIEYLAEPHQPKPLPKGKQAIYVFYLDDRCLYIGYAGSKSSSRFYSQHYNVKSNDGTLAGYLLKSGMSDYYGIKDWIKTNCWRINIYTDARFGTKILQNLRDFLKAQYKPLYGI